jgi:hypothetical protein
VLGDLAMNSIARKQPREAMPLIDRALSIIEKPGAPPLAVRFTMRGIRAQAELDLSHAAAALADAQIARDGYLGAHEAIAAADMRVLVADALWALGRRREAIAEVQQAATELQAVAKPDPEVAAKVKAWPASHH